MRKIHSKNSIFLLEILLNVLLFSFLLNRTSVLYSCTCENKGNFPALSGCDQL